MQRLLSLIALCAFMSCNTEYGLLSLTEVEYPPGAFPPEVEEPKEEYEEPEIVLHSEYLYQRSGIDPDETRKADYLLVIDNSGSMSEESPYVKEAIKTVVKRISKSGIDWRIGLISFEGSGILYSHDTVNYLMPLWDESFVSSWTNNVVNALFGAAFNTELMKDSLYYAVGKDILDCRSRIDPLTPCPLFTFRTLQGFRRDDADLSMLVFTDEPDQTRHVKSGDFLKWLEEERKKTFVEMQLFADPKFYHSFNWLEDNFYDFNIYELGTRLDFWLDAIAQVALSKPILQFPLQFRPILNDKFTVHYLAAGEINYKEHPIPSEVVSYDRDLNVIIFAEDKLPRANSTIKVTYEKVNN